jgi:putative ABC transport system substrate-binding protein
MRRREFIAGLASAAAWPVAARAQQIAIPVIGFLNAGSADSRAHLIKSFRQGLSDAGYTEGQNVTVEYRWGDDRIDRLPALAADLVRRKVSAIVTPGTTTASGSALSVAKAATSTIPIIFGIPDDPVKNSLVASMNRPGGNVTGIHYLSTALAEKRLGLLRELAPKAGLMIVLVNPKNQNALTATKEVQTAADTLGQKIEFINAENSSEIETAFATLAKTRPDALTLIPDPMFFSARTQIAALANRTGIPAIYTSRDYVEAGGLMSYGTDLAGVYRQVAGYAGRILKGANPAELPVEQSTKFEFVINLPCIKALRLDMPPMLLARADEVIE